MKATPAAIYLDHNATTGPSTDVRRALPELVEAWGNPSSIHAAGREPKRVLRETRQRLAAGLGCSPLELVFTSGATESNQAVFRSIWEECGATRPHVMISAVEHPSVVRAARWIAAQGGQVDVIPVDREGRLDLQFIQEKISERTALVSVMAANNETGGRFPISEVVAIARAKGARVHTDAVQTLGKVPVHLRDWGVDYASFSAHKFYSLKGTGLLYIRKGAPFHPLIWGGGQERHRRGGTENILGIGALGIMSQRLGEVVQRAAGMAHLRDSLEARLRREIPGLTVTGAGVERLSNTSSLVIAGVDGETLLMNLDLKGFMVSTGAACSSGNPEPSPVLLAMGLSRAEAQSSLRVSLGWETTAAEVEAFAVTLVKVVERLRRDDGDRLPAMREAR